MPTQQARHTLTMDAVARTIVNQVITDTNPVIRYKVFDERGKEVAFITNARASGRPGSWQISRIQGGRVGEDVGDYATATDALSALQKEFSKEMGCAEQQRLLSDERDAWAAWKALEGSNDEKELTRRCDNASDASTRLRLHISTCPECRPKTE